MNIKDIAKIAGVGVSTVSRVINQHPDVNEETRKKVLEIIKENNYIPNQSARLLKQTTSKNIGVLVKGIFNPFFSEMVNIIADKIEESKYTMILQHDTKEQEDIDSLVAFVKEHRLEGVIYLGGNFENVTEDRFETLGCKVILVCSNIPEGMQSPYFSSVGINDYKAAYKAMHYLLSKGHRSIALVIAEGIDNGVGNKRLRGYQTALIEHGIVEEDIQILEGHYRYEDAYTQTKKYLEKNNKISAICCASDTMAIGVAKAIMEQGKVIGKDIDLIGFDGMEITKYYHPSITTIKQPRAEIAINGVELLIQLLNNKAIHQHLLLPTVFIKGDSA